MERGFLYSWARKMLFAKRFVLLFALFATVSSARIEDHRLFVENAVVSLVHFHCCWQLLHYNPKLTSISCDRLACSKHLANLSTSGSKH